MRRWWIIPAVAAVLAAIGFAYWGYGLSGDKRQLVTYLNNRNQRAYFELTDHVQNMEVMLSKGIVSNSPRQRMMIFSDIWQQAYAAQENLTQIPMSGPSLTRTSKFLSQTGDFAWSLAKEYSRGLSLKSGDMQKLNKLHTEAGFLAVELQKVSNDVVRDGVSWAEIKTMADRNLRNQVPASIAGLERIERNMQDFPTLIYDGPFSEHIINRTPRGLTGSMVNGSQAAVVARKFAEAGTGTAYKVVKTEDVNGTIPAFRIHMTPQNAGTPVVITDISKKGGHPLLMLNTRAVNRKNVSRERAINIAERFLADRGVMNMAPTYVIEQQDTGVVIFENKQNGVIIYPDLMKVKVALDNGDIIGFEGTGYIMNHRARKNLKPEISEREAMAAVNPKLRIKSKKLALIPLENLQEVLVYEFRGDLNGDTFMVYINAKTGEEERILKVIDTNSGPVTM